MTSILPRQLASDRSGCLFEKPASARAGLRPPLTKASDVSDREDGRFCGA